MNIKIILLIVVFLLVLDRVFLYLERKGWLYYRTKKHTPAL